jgi:hypothetical protein
MDGFIARANIDHYLAVLSNNNLAPERRATATKLLIVEEDKLSHFQAQLEFAEIRRAESRDRVNRLRNWRDGLADGSAERADADRLLADVRAVHQLLDQFCHRMRERITSPGI